MGALSQVSLRCGVCCAQLCDHFVELAVTAYLVGGVAQGAPQTAGRVKGLRDDDAATGRVEPENLLIVARLSHRKKTKRVGTQGNFRRQQDEAGGIIFHGL